MYYLIEQTHWKGLTLQQSNSMKEAMERIADIRWPDVAPLLVGKINVRRKDRFTAGMPSPEVRYPALRAIMRLGKSAVPAIIAQLVAAQRPDVPPDNMLTSFHGNLLSALIDIVDPATVKPAQDTVYAYANEHRAQAQRLRDLADIIGKPKALPAPMATAPVTPKTTDTGAIAQEEPVEEKAAVQRLARIFELEAVLTQDAASSNEATVIAAIEELGRLQALRAVPLLVDKLDWKWAPPAPDPDGLYFITPMMATPQGLRSEKIAQAAKMVLLGMGSTIVPALLDAVALRDRTPQLYADALHMLIQATGSEEAARKALRQVADENEGRYQRLRKIAQSMNKMSP